MEGALEWGGWSWTPNLLNFHLAQGFRAQTLPCQGPSSKPIMATAFSRAGHFTLCTSDPSPGSGANDRPTPRGLCEEAVCIWKARESSPAFKTQQLVSLSFCGVASSEAFEVRGASVSHCVRQNQSRLLKGGNQIRKQI